MAHSGAFATSGATIFKAGANAAPISEANMNDLHLQAEALINTLTRKNYTDSFASLNSDVKYILGEVASNLTAIYVIESDMARIGRVEAESRINVLRDAALRGINLLKDQKTDDFINAA